MGKDSTDSSTQPGGAAASPRIERLRRLTNLERPDRGARLEAVHLILEECDDIVRRAPAAPFCSLVPVLVMLLLVILAEEAR